VPLRPTPSQTVGPFFHVGLPGPEAPSELVPPDQAGAVRIEFATVKPGPVPAAGAGVQAPHIDVSVFARGLLKRLVTRVYFPDEAEANQADPVLRGISDPEVRSTLVAREEDGALRFDVHLQGDGETAFFAV
jgi:protocatechuate 3,4-dioxygenase alpha subunit